MMEKETRLFPPRMLTSPNKSKGGQSLVEFSLSLPILLLIVVATVEVSNVLYAMSEMQQFAREGARFAGQGNSDDDIASLLLGNYVNEGGNPGDMDDIQDRYGEDLLELWVIRPEVVVDADDGSWSWKDSDGSNWGVTENCLYGDVCSASGIDANTVLSRVGNLPITGTDETLDGEVLTVVVVTYNVASILNINIFNPAGDTGFFPIQAFAVIRQEAAPPIPDDGGINGGTGVGCAVFPIAIYADPSTMLTGDPLTLNRDTSLSVSTAEDSFVYLRWQLNDNTEGDLAAALKSSLVSVDDTVPTWYINQFNSSPNDHDIKIGKQVYRTEAGLSATAQTILEEHMDAVDAGFTIPTPRKLLVIFYTAGLHTQGATTRSINIAAFGRIEITGYTASTLNARFIDTYTGCGQ